MLTRRPLISAAAALGACAAFAAGAILGRPDVLAARGEDSAAPARVPGANPSARQALRRTPIVEAVEKAAPSVVSIGTTQLVQFRYFDWSSFSDRLGRQEQKGLGSGVIVHPSGLVVTNAHVINMADQVVVRLTGLDAATEVEIPATILATDLAHDLALLRMEKPGPYPAATFGRSDDLMPGETVIAIGSPVGLGRTVSSGIISALGRSMTIERQTFEGLIQTDAAVNRGNSGGALLNILGEWIGVNSAIASLSGGSDGISFAIPVATVESFLSRAIQTGRVTGVWAGLEFADAGAGSVRVGTVYPAGPAIREGVRLDAEVVEVDGAPVSSAAQATLAVLDAAPNRRVELGFRTATGVRRVRIPLEAPPTDALTWKRLGFKAVEIGAEVSAQADLRGVLGLVVTEVREDSPASRTGLIAGDVVLALGEGPVRTPEDLLVVTQWAEKDTTLAATVMRRVRSRWGEQRSTHRVQIGVE